MVRFSFEPNSSGLVLGFERLSERDNMKNRKDFGTHPIELLDLKFVLWEDSQDTSWFFC